MNASTSNMSLSKNSFCDMSKYIVTNYKRLSKFNETGTCDISFSLASNSHGNFYTKIAFH